MKAPCAKLMIFITPNTIRRPDDTINRIAVVVAISNKFVIMARYPEPACGSRYWFPRQVIPLGLQVRALPAGINTGKALDDLNAAITLDLTQIHAQWRMVLLRHHDRSARSLDADLAKSLEHGATLGAAGLFDRGLVGVDGLVFRHGKVVRRFQVCAEL